MPACSTSEMDRLPHIASANDPIVGPDRGMKDAPGRHQNFRHDLWPIQTPVLDLQSANTRELAHVRRHQDCSEGKGVGGDE